MAPPPLLDANIVLRHLLADHPDHSPRATAYLERIARGEIRVRVAETFVFDAVFVLERTAKRSKSDIRDDVRDLLDLPGIELPTKVRMRRALDRFAALNIAFVDAYQSVLMEELGLTDIVSFDRHFDRVPALRRIEP